MTEHSAIPTLLDLTRQRAREHKEAPLFTYLRDGEFDEQCCSYAELDRRAREIGGWLQERAAVGQRVLLVYPQGIEYIAAFFGCIYAGAVAVPAYPPRKNRQAERICRMVADADVRVALTTADLLEQMRPAIAVEPRLASLPWQATEEVGGGCAASWREPDLHSDSIAFLQYTSGSTGLPKGVVVSHGNILDNQRLIRHAFRQDVPVVVGWLPLHHDMGLIGNVLHPLYMGGRLIFLSPVDFLQRPLRWLNAISRYRGTISGGPNFAYELCLEGISANQCDGLDLSSWNVAFNGAEPVRAKTMAEFSSRFAAYGFAPAAFCPCYGMAETTLLLAGAVRGERVITTAVDAAALENGRVVPIVDAATDAENQTRARKHLELAACGVPDPSMDTKIVDPDSQLECSADRVGEIWVSGDSVAQGYWQQPDATEATFRARIRIPGNGSATYSQRRYLRTGDLGFRYQGQLYVTGRLKDLIIHCGANHYPQDIERTVAASHEGLTPGAGAAFAVEDHGAEAIVVVQEVKRTHIRKLDHAAVFASIRAAVMDEHQLPLRSIVLLRPGSIPKTTSGKLQRREARRLFQENEFAIVARWDLGANPPAPEGNSTDDRQASSAGPEPRSPVSDAAFTAAEDDRAKIRALQDWILSRLSRRLRVPRELLDIRQPFAQLGVDSLNAVRLSGELSELLGRPYPPTLAYQFPTIEALCEFLVRGPSAHLLSDEATTGNREEPLAIIGIGCRFPGSPSVDSFWQLLQAGRDATTTYPTPRWRDHWHQAAGAVSGIASPIPRGGFIDHVDQFDACFFGINAREADEMDPQQRLLLEVAWETFEDAGVPVEALAGSRTGVFFGLSSCDYLRLQFAAGHEVNGYTATGSSLAIASNRISYTCDLRGPSLTIDTACSSSLVAVHQACASLRLRQCDLALAGGVNLILSPDATSALSQAGMLSPTGVCHAFAAAADGFVRGEGCGLILLKPLSRAVLDGDRIYAVLRGSATNQDGRSNGLTAPNTSSQQAVIRAALADARLKPGDVDYVEAHGTGTELGDPIEMQSLQAVFAEGDQRVAPLRVGSVKTNIGHLEAAAGIAGLIKVCLALHHEAIPRNLHFDEPSPHIDWKRLVAVPTDTQPWRRGERPRLAGVSSFGFGGTNAHVIVEEAPELAARQETSRGSSARLLTLSAKTFAALQQRALDVGRIDPELPLADVCHSANAGRGHFDHRLAVRVESTQDAIERLTAFGNKGKASRLIVDQVDSDYVAQWLFTGQGGTHLGAGQWLYEAHAPFRSELDCCAEALARFWPRPLKTILWEDEQWWRRVDVQPALFCLQYALARLWQSWGVEPSAVLGHSVGEYAAACVAGVFSLEDALKLVTRRAELFGQLATSGRMLAVMASEEVVRSCLAEIDPSGRTLDVACINGPQQIVIAGAEQSIAAASTQLNATGVQTRPLVTTHAFHSPLVEPLLDDFTAVAEQLTYARPRIPYVSSLLGDYSHDEVATPEYWRRHLREPVRFYEASSKLLSSHAISVEIGVGSTLSTLFRISHPDLDLAVLPGLTGKPDEWDALLVSLAKQYTRGARINWRAVSAAEGRIVSLPTYPFERKRHWFRGQAQQPQHALESPPGERIHPLLGTRLDLGLRQTVFETDLSRLPYLRDHVVNAAIVFAAAGYLELAIAAGEIEGLKRHEVRNLSIETPLAWQPAEPCRVQVILSPDDAGFDCRIMRHQANRWQRHATCRLEPALQPPPATGMAEACGEVVDIAELYERCRSAGLEYGPAFQGLRHLVVNNKDAWGEIELPAELSDSGYVLHPSLLDASLQVTAGLLRDDLSGAWIPTSVSRYQVFGGPAAAALRVHACIAPASDGQIVRVDIELADQSGRLVAQIEQLTLQRVPSTISSNLLYRESWVPRIRPADPSPSIAGASPQLVAGNLLRERARIGQSTGIAAHVPLLESLEPLAVAWVVQAMRALQIDLRPGTTVTGAAADRAGIAPGHRRLFRRMLSMLAEVGYLKAYGDDWEVVRAPADENPEEVSERLVRQYPAGRAEVTLLRRCGSQLAQVLRGELDPLSLLFPPDGQISAADVYRDTVGGRTLNALVAESVRAAVDELSDGRGLRVLEIGAGTGATTEAVLAILPQHRSRYVFSDIASGFLAQARSKFSAFDHVEYRLLDIERDPAAQDFAAESFDLIIAANVLHATADLRNSLTNVRHLLKPGGGLLLVEGTRPVRWLDLTFGLTPGWWRFQDVDIRGDYPLLSSAGWQAQLKELGFEDPGFVHPYDSPDPARDPENSVIVTRRIAPGSNAEGSMPAHQEAGWIVLSDNIGVGAALVEGLTGRGKSCAVAFARTGSNGHHKTGQTALARGELRGWLQRAFAAGRPRDIVCLWPLDFADERLTPPQQAAALNETLLEFIQDVADEFGHGAANGEQALRVWIVTRGGQAAAEDATQAGLAQSTLWGLMRTISLEFPHWHCCGIDLDPAVLVAAAAAALLDELIAVPRDAEREIGFRHGRRLVRRLVAGDGREMTAQAEPNETSVLAVTSRGTIDGLQWMRRPRREPDPGEIEVEVHASGLNFRDVLNTLGLYDVPASGLGLTGRPGGLGACPSPAAPPLGAECAGVVIRTGDPRSDLSVGDRVLVVAPESICSVITVPVHAAIKIPDGLSFEQAATLPIAFLTASMALEEVGDIGRGERVLIHSAAGGVGLAAIQLAHDAGTEVFATASVAKHEMLRELGIEHVYDSRQVGFADEILAATNGAGVHLVLNSLADGFFTDNLRVLAPRGRYLDIAKSHPDTVSRIKQLRPDVTYDQIDLSLWLQAHPELLRPKLERILRRCHKGRLHALPHTCFKRTDAVRAFRLMQSGTSIGKILLSSDEIETSRAATPPAGEPESHMLFRGDATYLITGGLGGIGLLTARWMSEQGTRHIALLARREPNAAERQAIDGIEATGCQVHVLKANVADEWQLNEALTNLRSTCPPLAGVFHLAGVLDDALLGRQTPEKFTNAFAPKVLGGWNLHRATMADRLDYFVCFSSAASVLGSPGQANHAAANAFLDMLAHHRRSQGLAGLSLNWGPWSGVGAAAKRGVGKRGDLGGVGLLTPDEGLEILFRQLQRGGCEPAQVAAMRLDPRKFLAHLGPLPLFEQLRAQASDRGNEPERQTRFLEEFRAVPPTERRGLMLAQLRQLVASTLGMDHPDKVPPDEALFDMGLDSLTSLELRNKLEARLGVKVPATLIFDYPTLAGLANHFTSMLNASCAAAADQAPVEPAAQGERPVPAAAAGRENLDELMRSIHDLTTDLDQWEQRHA